jgi:hypothetical protein
MMERKKRVAAERGYASTRHVGYTGANELNGAGGGYTQEYKYAPTELNAQEVHELAHHKP